MKLKQYLDSSFKNNMEKLLKDYLNSEVAGGIHIKHFKEVNTGFQVTFLYNGGTQDVAIVTEFELICFLYSRII